MRIFGRIVFLLIAAVMLFPAYWMLMGSFQDVKGMMRIPPSLIPRGLTLYNYRWVLRDNMVWRWALNTVMLAVGVIAVVLVITTLAGYGFAAFEFPGKRLIFGALLLGLFVHRYMLLIPQFVMVSKLGIGGTLYAAAWPLLYYPIGVYLFRNYLQSVSSEIMDAARIDGCGHLRLLGSVLVPLCGPIIALIVMSKGLETIGDYLWQMLALQPVESRTWIVGLIAKTREGAYLQGLNPIGQGLAVGVLIGIPMLGMYLATAKMFVGGINVGGVKS